MLVSVALAERIAFLKPPLILVPRNFEHWNLSHFWNGLEWKRWKHEFESIKPIPDKLLTKVGEWAETELFLVVVSSFFVRPPIWVFLLTTICGMTMKWMICGRRWKLDRNSSGTSVTSESCCESWKSLEIGSAVIFQCFEVHLDAPEPLCTILGHALHFCYPSQNRSIEVRDKRTTHLKTVTMGDHSSSSDRAFCVRYKYYASEFLSKRSKVVTENCWLESNERIWSWNLNFEINFRKILERELGESGHHHLPFICEFRINVSNSRDDQAT